MFKTLIELAIVSEYWYHCHLFPHSTNLTVEAVDELRGILSHCICGESYNEPVSLYHFDLIHTDSLTSSTSTVPYNITDLNEMMFVVNSLSELTSNIICPPSTKLPLENPSTGVPGGGVSAYSVYSHLLFPIQH